MDKLELLDLIKKGESSTVQFKVRVHDAYKIGTEMVALSNTKGGRIVIGIDDKTGDLNGLTYSEIQATNQLLANAASDNVKPPIYILTETIIINNKCLVIADVSEGISKPHTDNKGIIWVKNGSDKRKVVAREEMARLLQSSGNMYADEIIVKGTSIDDIDVHLFEKFVHEKYKDTIKNLGLTIQKILQNNGMLRAGELSLGALLLFGENPQQYRPTYTVQCISIVGNDISSSQFRDKEDPFIGNFQVLYKKTLSFIIRNLKKIQKDESFNSPAVLEVPKEAIEELLVNALVHRDYFINTSIKVLIFDNRIEIISPGKLPNTLTIENVKAGISIPRNPVIFSNVRHILPFVGVGSGIPRAFKKYPDIELINDTDRELFISIIRRKAT